MVPTKDDVVFGGIMLGLFIVLVAVFVGLIWTNNIVWLGAAVLVTGTLYITVRISKARRRSHAPEGD